MSTLRAVVGEVVGLFVTSWVDTMVTLVVVAGLVGLARVTHSGWIGLAAALALALQLVVSAAVRARR